MKHFPNSEKSKWMIGLAAQLCAFKRYIKSGPVDDESDIKVKLVVNAYGMLILDGMIEGKRHRFSTKKRATLWNILKYTCQIKTVFMHLYEERFDMPTTTEENFRTYGQHILENTKNYRNLFSQREELSRFRKLCRTFGSMALGDIKASHILKWQNNFNMAPNTVINYRGTLNIIFKYAVYDELMSSNPLSVVRAPKVIRKEIQVFKEREIRLLLKYTTGQLHNIIQFVAFTGVRAGELIALRWSDIDFEEDTISISKRIREGNEDIPKSKRSRVLDMLPQAKEALIHQARLTKKRSEYIFTTRFGAPYKRSNKISAAIRRVCKKAHINGGTLQTLRRSCNTLYKQYGLPNDWILDQLGHMQDDVNRRHYTGKIKPDLSHIGTLLSE